MPMPQKIYIFFKGVCMLRTDAMGTFLAENMILVILLFIFKKFYRWFEAPRGPKHSVNFGPKQVREARQGKIRFLALFSGLFLELSYIFFSFLNNIILVFSLFPEKSFFYIYSEDKVATVPLYLYLKPSLFVYRWILNFIFQGKGGNK